MPAKPRPRLSRAARREQILGAALRVFGEGGYHGTHVDDIVREAAVARGTFYLHFESKHAVFAALVDRMLQIFLDTRPPDHPRAVRTPADAQAVLRSSYRLLFETFREHRHLCRLLLEEAQGLDKGFAAKVAEHFRVWHERVAATRREFIAAGVARADLDVEVTAHLVLGMVVRTTRQFLFEEAEPDLDRLVDAIVAFELGGIRAG